MILASRSLRAGKSLLTGLSSIPKSPVTQLIYSENLGKRFEKGHLGEDDQQDAKFRCFTRSLRPLGL